MSEKPLFSVLMANYNNANYIYQAIDSVLKQSYPYWELIIVDDASTDDSLGIIQPYLKDKRIKLIRLKKRMGCGGAKRVCAEKAKGEILGVLDSDDALHKDAIKTIVKAYKEDFKVGWIQSTYYECNDKLVPQRVGKIESAYFKKNIRLKWVGVYHFNTFRRNEYKKTSGFDKRLIVAEDRDLEYKLEEVTKFKLINKPLYFYRVHKKGISQGNQIKDSFFYETLAKYEAYKRRLNTDIPNITKKEMCKLLLKGIYSLLKLRRLNYMSSFLIKTIRLIKD